MKKPSALLSADLHIREDKPICRTDDFPDAIVPKIELAKKICDKYNIPFIVAGDIFEYWRNWQTLLYLVIDKMPKFICIPGQHDLPRHNINLFKKSSLAVLRVAEKAVVITKPGQIVIPNECQDNWPDDYFIIGYPYGTDVKNYRRRKHGKKAICLIHDLVTKKDDPFPGANALLSKSLLDKFTNYDLILSGDNHKQFTMTKNNRHLINPGSMVRQDADQVDHQPCFYLWYAEDNSFDEIKIPIDKEVVVRTHIESKKERDDRIDKYIDSMESNYEIKLDYKKNLENHIKSNDVEEEVEQFILKCLEV